MITKIRLKNWKSHMDSEFEFSRGVNAIIGIMGSGKTSIMQAISFGLYGTFPAHQARRIGLEELIMKRPQVMDESEICICFTVGDREFTVTRNIRRGKGTVKAELREGDMLIEATPQGVTKEVSRILDMDYDLFSKAVYSEQDAIDYFLRIPRGQRTGHIDRMLRLDRFEKVREGAVSLSNRIKQEREEKLRILSDLRKEELPGRIDRLRRELGEFKEGMEGLEIGFKDAERRVEETEKEISVFEKNESELNENIRMLEGVDSGIKQIEDSIGHKKGELDGIDIKEIGSRLAEAEERIERYERAIEEREGESDRNREKLASLNTEIRMITDSLDSINKLGDRCPVCESRITPGKKRELVNSREENEERLRKEVSVVASEIEKSGKVLDELESELGKSLEERERLKGFMRDTGFLAGLEERKKEYSKRRERIVSRKSLLEEKLKEFDIIKIREELKKAVGEERELKARLDATLQRMHDKEEMLKELRTREEMLIRYRQEGMLDQEVAENLHKFVAAVRLTQGQLRQEFLKTVNMVMNRIWGELYPYGDFTGIRLAIENDYVLQLKDQEGWTSVEGMASGGERSMAALALRVAFSMAFIPNLRWLILDEPTHNLDTNAIDYLTEALRDRISSFAEQVFLITHDDRVSEGVGGNLYRLERNKERNEPTRIAETGIPGM